MFCLERYEYSCRILQGCGTCGSHTITIIPSCVPLPLSLCGTPADLYCGFSIGFSVGFSSGHWSSFFLLGCMLKCWYGMFFRTSLKLVTNRSGWRSPGSSLLGWDSPEVHRTPAAAWPVTTTLITGLMLHSILGPQLGLSVVFFIF